jgi:hypothetical protein
VVGAARGQCASFASRINIRGSAYSQSTIVSSEPITCIVNYSTLPTIEPDVVRQLRRSSLRAMLPRMREALR